ncbi:MAG: hypothetical protein FWF21_12870 [Micrococcales bacterium]|nr:hypothetical protein [Micrococcales bacterium]
MGKTYRRNASGGYRTEGGQKKASTRPKSRSKDGSSGRYQTAKQRQIVATAVHRSDPDLKRFGRAIIESAMRRAELQNNRARSDDE